MNTLSVVANRLFRYGLVAPLYYALKGLLFAVLVVGRVFTWFWVWVPVGLASLIALLYFLIVLAAFPDRTPNMLNYGFGTLAVLATLSFACCRAVEDEPQPHFLRAGQRFFRAALLFLLASVLQYALLEAPSALATLFPHVDPALLSRLTFPYRGTVEHVYQVSLGTLFLIAMASALNGVIILNRVLHADRVFAKLTPARRVAGWRQLVNRWLTELQGQWRSL